MTGYMNKAELEAVGFSSFGSNVFVSRLASIYGAERINLGSNVRIDDFCVFSAGHGGISIGNYVHIAVFSSLIGRGRISIDDFSNVSSRVSIYSSSDDFHGNWMTNPMVPPEYTGVTHADVIIRRHCIIGCGSVILPGTTLDEGVAIGALSLVTHDCVAYGIYAGTPAVRRAARSTHFLEVEQCFHKGIKPTA